uniref:DUF3085 domain-containing protein n=1 Tax=Escherichia coli TaxID=562 RepID=UPI001F16698C|nr:DUF3085 domain-containing protein [Escherichia coli]
MNQTGEFFWPSSKHIDPARLTPQILLVKDHGVYLITNASLDGTPVSRDTVVYARGMNPSVDDEWYDEAEEALGGDDSSVSIPVAWFELALKKRNLMLLVSKYPPQKNHSGEWITTAQAGYLA